MNEILKKRIENIPYRITRVGNGANDAYNEGVRHGAEWMLSHMWISVEEALPELKERVLVAYYGITRISICIMKRIPHDSSNPNNPEWHWSLTNNKEDVIAWTPIPEFTEGGGNAE